MDLLQCSQDCIMYQRLDTGEGNRQLFPRLPAAFYCLKMFPYLVFTSDLEPKSGRPIFKDEALGSHLKSCSKITYSRTFLFDLTYVIEPHFHVSFYVSVEPLASFTSFISICVCVICSYVYV